MNRSEKVSAGLEIGTLFTTLAATSLISTILLVTVGSIVRVTGYGLGCPDWPLCYGRAVPPLETAAWVEFGHRLLGGIVAVQIAGLAWLAYRDHRHERWIWIPAALATLLLVIQIALGGIHVLNELPRWTGLIHTGVATAIVGMLAQISAVSRPALYDLSHRLHHSFSIRTMKTWSLVCASATYVLILSGSLVTRTGASLACPSFPHCGIRDIPENLQNLVAIQMIHRIVALIVALAVAYLLFRLVRNGWRERQLRVFFFILLSLFIVQIGLGISNVLLALPLWSRILHLGVATTIWTVVVILAVLFQQPVLNLEPYRTSGSVARKEGPAAS